MHQQSPLGAPAAGGIPGAAAAAGAGLPEMLTPATVAQALGVSEADVMAIIESGELPAKKIGASYRIRREALNQYLAS
jgi:excisionase family DNA binding protein